MFDTRAGPNIIELVAAPYGVYITGLDDGPFELATASNEKFET